MRAEGAAPDRGGRAGSRNGEEVASQVGSATSSGTAWAAANNEAGGGGGGTRRASAFAASFASALDIYSQSLRGARVRPGAPPSQQPQQQQSTERSNTLPRKMSQSSSLNSTQQTPTRQPAASASAASASPAALEGVRQPFMRSKPMTVLHAPSNSAAAAPDARSERDAGDSNAPGVSRSNALLESALERVRQTHMNRQYGLAASSILTRPSGFAAAAIASDSASKSSANDDRYSKMSDADVDRILGRMREQYLNK